MIRLRIVILGAGPAGVGAAFKLTRKSAAEVTLLEQRDVPGGDAGSSSCAPSRPARPRTRGGR